MLICEFTIDHPILGGALRVVPRVEAEWEETYTDGVAGTRMLFWLRAETDDEFVAFEEAVARLDTVTDLTLFATVPDRRLYRVRFTEEGDRTNLMSELIDVAGVLEAATGTAEGWRCRVHFPTREGYRRVYQFCRDHDIPFTFERMYQQTSEQTSGESTLTEPQRELLLEAVESGYLDIPRAVSLADLGERLGISQSSASERFRRGVKKLIRANV
ncbi:helix-turn-helix domain-containing protein [Halobaculum limi]|uniref:helix-turn-helix domain-containing protein n=1 Tax=Halobaculum limi TaxID=3031916 RepID=UPI002405405A|nr:helix-turn-helix domain-containing protein [Halobaculum sp. YSMS11]